MLGAAATRRALMDFLWPGQCPVCSRWLAPGDHHLVRATDASLAPLVHRGCLEALPRIDSAIPPPHPEGGASWRVHHLWRDNTAFFGLLHQLKYEGRRHLVEPLATALGEWVASWLPPDTRCWVVPVPDDPVRRVERGFSVNEALAAGVAAQCSLPLHTMALRRRRPAPALALLEGPERRRRALQGVLGVARLAEIPRNAEILLVDDQITTGETLRACVRLLVARGHGGLALCLAGAKRAPRQVGP